jgi:hypothetical protein
VALMNALPLESTWTFFFFFVTGAATCFAKDNFLQMYTQS